MYKMVSIGTIDKEGSDNNLIGISEANLTGEASISRKLTKKSVTESKQVDTC